MRVGIVDHVSAGGVSRFVVNLIDGLVRRDDITAIDYYVSVFNIERDGLVEHWAAQPKVTLRPIKGAMDEAWALERTPVAGAARAASAALARFPLVHAAVRAIYRRLIRRSAVDAPPWYTYSLDSSVVSSLEACDVAYFAWPFFVEPIALSRPIVGTFHDFHFERFPETYPPDQLELARRQTETWLSRVDTCVTSTRFVSGEVDRFFSARPRARQVVYLAAYTMAPLDRGPDEALLQERGINRPYIIYSGGVSGHKNVLSIFQALKLIRDDRGEAPLFVLTGIGTHLVGDKNAPEGSAVAAVNRFIQANGLERGVDFLPLGYVSEHDVDELTRAANLVVSASLYEAGCGPALDAWQLGAPVAFSEIPPFLEQLERFGVEALVFDPEKPREIARAIDCVTSDPNGLAEMAARSREKMRAYTWDHVAAGYAQVFAQAIAR